MLLRGSYLQLARLGAGLVLLVFVVTHFLNHALGLFGLEAMDWLQTLRFAVTRSWAGSLLLGLAFLVHIGLGLARLAGRRTLRMSLWEGFQIGSGLLIPLLLIDHVVTTRGAATLLGMADHYRPVLAVLWPDMAARQALLLVLVWAHALVGVHHWLRLAPWYPRLLPGLVTFAVLLPAMALAGFVAAGREVALVLSLPGGRAALEQAYQMPDVAGQGLLVTLDRILLASFALAVAATAGVLTRRLLAEQSRPKLTVTYTAGPVVTGPIGATLLEISRARGVPHAAICGGRARCSTCRVRIDASDDVLPASGFAEATTLGAIHAPAGVRLACQLRPLSNLTVTRLVAAASAGERIPGAMAADAEGAERHLAVMFLDLKGFTALSERRLPYDVVYLLNRFFRTIGEEIVSEGGWIDKYMGDGLLAVFGREAGLHSGARAALSAARRIDLALDALNAELATEGSSSVGVGIGIHAGPLVVGRVGYAAAAQVTVIGATVNLASRLESLTREKGCQLIVSRALADAAGWPGSGCPTEQVVVKGTRDPVEILKIARARDVVQG